jgi:hypothetical protein
MADPPTVIVREMMPSADWSAMASPGQAFSPYSSMRWRRAMRFSKSKRRAPASTTMIETPGRSSASFCARSAAEIPPPMMQMSQSCVGIYVPRPGKLSRSVTSL